MDIISHGLYGSIAFGRRSRISFWKAFLFGILPDLSSFGIFTVVALLGSLSGPDLAFGRPDESILPSYVYQLYDLSHSLVVATLVCGTLWIILGRPIMELFAWPLHIVVDIPTHSSAFFPTPFLWPLSDFTVDGIGWSSPYIFIPNVVLLALLYAYFLYRRRTLSRKEIDKHS